MWMKFVLRSHSQSVLESGKTVVRSVPLSGEAVLPRHSMGRRRQSVADVIILDAHC